MIKTTLKFTGVGGSTWTELLYFAGTFSQSAAPFNNQLIAQRLAFLDNQCTLRLIKYSNPDGGTRASAVFAVNQKGTYVSGGNAAALADVAAVWQLNSATPLASRKMWMHGMNTAQYTVDQTTGEPYILAGAKQQIQAYVSLLVFGGMVIRCLTRGLSLGNGLFAITQAERDPLNPKNTILTTQGNTGFAANDMLVIRGTDRKTAPGLTGTYKALTVATNKITVNYTMPTATVAFSGGATVRQATYVSSAAVTQASYHSIAAKKVKETFFDSRGARSAQRIRHLA